MTFPATPLELKTELNINGAWTDVTAYTYQRDGYSITRGRRSEGSTADASTCTLTFDNRDGRFSPRNPTGPYYGYIGRNTRVRVSIPAVKSHLDVPAAASGNYVSCPDNARLDITGDIDIRADAWFATITWGTSTSLVAKWDSAGNQRSYLLSLEAGGYPKLWWSTNGTASTSVQSTYPVPAPITGRRAIRATLDVNNGSGGYTVTFYTSGSIDGSWTQLDQSVTTAGTTSIFSGTANLYVGSAAQSTYLATQNMRVYAAQVRNGIGGSAAANPDFTVQTDADPSFDDAAGNTWTVAGAAAIVGRDYRFWGEISEWPSEWDVSGRDVYVPVTASGIMRRLNSGSKPLKSAYYRGCTSPVAPVTGLKGYWPCEDAAGATTLAYGLTGGSPMTISGTPTLATDSTSFPCSAPLPDVGTAAFSGNVPDYTSTGQIQLRFLLAVPAAGTTNGAIVASLRCGGTATRWEIVYNTGGSLSLNAYSELGASLLAAGPFGFNVNGVPLRLGLSLTQSGANVTYALDTLAVGNTTGAQNSGTLNSQTVTAARSVTLAASKNMTGCIVGHVTVQSAVTSVYDLSDHLNAYDGETAVDRFARLCGEEGVGCIVLGDDGLSQPMGPQGRKTLLELLRECETADGGLIYEPRDMFGLAYRSAGALSTQAAALTLDYSANDLSSGFRPVEDDQQTANDVTVTRDGGSSYRYTVASGALSTLDPPNGVGTYDRSVTVNVSADSQLPDIASWRAHLGTVDEARYPAIPVNLARTNFTGSTAQQLAVARLDIGDRVDVANPPAWMPPDDITQLAVGYTERLNGFEHTITWVGVPASPWRVAVFDDGVSRYSGDGTTLAEDLDTTETGIDVTNPSGVEWGHGDGDYGVVTGGEVMTVTGVASTELIANGTFEVDTNDWWANGGSISWSAVAHSGSHSLLLTSAAGFCGAESGALGLIPVSPGEVVTVSAWLRPNTSRQVQVSINYFNSSSVYQSSYSGVISGTANTWSQVTVTDIVPAGIAYIDVIAANYGTPGAGLLLYVDDVTVTSNRRQTLTVTRSVNGVVKTHSSGAALDLAEPCYYGT